MFQKALRRRREENNLIPSNNKPCSSAQPQEWEADKEERKSEAFLSGAKEQQIIQWDFSTYLLLGMFQNRSRKGIVRVFPQDTTALQAKRNPY